MTVLGPILPEEFGPALPHEHLLVDFSGWDARKPYDVSEVIDVVTPHVRAAYDAGMRGMAECTPAYLARDPEMLREVSKRTGMHLVTNCGYYGAVDDKFVPSYAHGDTPDALAERWTREFREGIGNTGIRPGFIKTAVDNGPLSHIDEKLVRAACRCQRETGLTIGCHTTSEEAIRDIARVLEDEEAPPGRFIWIHAQAVDDPGLHLDMAERGMWIEFDGIRPNTIARHVGLVQQMREAGHLSRVLLSHDAGWYTVGEPKGGDFRGFTLLSKAFLPALREAGVAEDAITRLTKTNPARAFAIRPVKKDLS